MNNIGNEMQTANLAKAYDNSFDYTMTPIERAALGCIAIIGILIVGLTVWGIARIVESRRVTDRTERVTARIVEQSKAVCRDIRNRQVLERVYYYGMTGDRPVAFRDAL